MTDMELLAVARLDLSYDSASGVFTWLRSKKGPGARAGEPAGWTRPDGYVSIKVGGVKVFAHRLAWLMVHGKAPEHNIDHIDGNPSNNAIANLRDVPQAMNVHNIRATSRRRASGLPRGVKRNGKGYSAAIQVNGKWLYLGQFITPDDASAAYLKARAELHEGFVA